MKPEKTGVENLYLAPEEMKTSDTIAFSEYLANETPETDSFMEPTKASQTINKAKEIPELRRSNLKTFHMSDGTKQAVFPPSSMHVLNQQTQTYEEVDTTLTKDEDGRYFTCGKNHFVAKFSREEENDELFFIQKGAHKVSVYARKNQKNRNKGVTPVLHKSTKEGTNAGEFLTFTNVEADTDYEYFVEGVGVKENIIVKNPTPIYRYPFTLICENVTARFDEKTKRISFVSHENNEEVFFIPPPFMMDAKGTVSTGVTYELKELSSGQLSFTVVADCDWINDRERVFPITIDPQIKLAGNATMTTYSWDNGSLYTSNYHTIGTKMIEGSGACNTHRMYMNFNLPSLPHNPRIKKAEITFIQNSGVDTCGLCPNIGLYRVTEDICIGNNTPLHDSDLIDFAKMKAGRSENGQAISYTFDVTSLLDKLNKGESNSTNLVLKMIDEDILDSYVVLCGASSSNYPILTITYESSYGVNTSYRTHTHELGRFGQGSVDLQCGNLMFESEDFAWSGNRMPVTIKHLFNSALAGYDYTHNASISLNTADFHAMKIGCGFKLNLMQSMIHLDSLPVASWTEKELCEPTMRQDGYVYINENGEETYFKMSIDHVRCDSNSQCYNLYKDVDGGDMLYDPAERTLKQGDDTYLFDASGRLVRITDAAKNRMDITYTSNRISSVTDGAGREFGFAYDSNHQLTSIVAPDNTYITYGYTDSLLTSVTYPDGKKAVLAYISNKPASVTLQDANGAQVYKVAYTFNGDRLETITEYGSDDSLGAQSTYFYSVAASRTLVSTTEQQDTNEGETANNVITTTYTFDDDGNIVSEYVYSTDTGKVGGDGEESGINPHSGDGGAGIVSNINNLLRCHNFEVLAAWSEMPCNCGDLYVTNYAHEPSTKFGKKLLRMQSHNADCGENGVYQVTTALPAGQYTFSAYVRVISAFKGTDAGAFLRITDTYGNILGVSERLTKTDTEYTRLILPFELSEEQSVEAQILVNGKGTVYVDAAQLENNPYANTYNMLENGNFEYGTFSWTLSSGASVSTEDRFNMSKALRINGSLNAQAYASQKLLIKANASTRETFTLSGWAKGYGLPNHERDGVKTPTFRLRAVITYNDNSTQTEVADFSPCTEEWQLASVQFAKNTCRTVKYIMVYCDYDYNYGTAYFDDIQLVRNSIETELSSKDFPSTSANTDIADATETLIDKKPTFNEVMDIYGNVLTNTLYSDGEFGTVYRSYGFTPDCNAPENAGNDLVRETDARGNETTYTVDGDTSRREEITDRCGNKIAYEYDKEGKITKITHKDSEDTLISDVSCKYDSLYNVTKMSRGDGMKYAFSYNPFHRLESIGIDNKPENLIFYSYKNGNGRLKEMRYANGDTMKATYNSIGQMVAETWYNSNNVEISRYKYVYDRAGNIVRSIDTHAQKEYNYVYENGMLTSAREYDIALQNDLVTSKTVVSIINYFYNKIGQVIKKTITVSDHSTFTYYYDYTDGNIVSKFFVDEIPITSHNKVDKLGRKVFDELQLSTGFVSRQYSYYSGSPTFEHKLTKNLKSAATTQLISQIALSDGRTISYEYDDEERITKVTDSFDGVTEYAYDALGQLLTETVNDVVVNRMTYDNYGNIVSKNNKQYCYDATWNDLLTCYDGQEIVYDAQGNPVSYLGHTLTWEKARQLRSFDSNIYTYNANGIRTSKTVDGVKHTYTLEGTKILKETWNNNVLIPLYDNEESVCGILYNGVPYYFLKNFQGDVIAVVDSNEKTIANYTYDAWGKVVSVSGEKLDVANINPFRYRGYYYDRETRMYYLQSRYYDPETGRFVNADVTNYILNTHSTVSSNLFTYCGNTPVNGVDMFGYCYTTVAPVIRYPSSSGTSSSPDKKFEDYVHDNWIAKLFESVNKNYTPIDHKGIGYSIKLTLYFDYKPSKMHLTENSFNASFGSGSLSLGWGGKLEAGFGWSIGRYSLSYLKGVDWERRYLAITIACATQDGKHECACELYFSISHWVVVTIAVILGVVVPTLVPVITSVYSLLTTPGAIAAGISTLIPMLGAACG